MVKHFSNRTKKIFIPIESLKFSFSRSSGAGGQSVNKLNTKAELRVNVNQADWLSEGHKGRIMEVCEGQINKKGELIIVCEEERSQHRNKNVCIDKLKGIIAQTLHPPKKREMYKGRSEKHERKRVDGKRKRGDVKKQRKNVKISDW